MHVCKCLHVWMCKDTSVGTCAAWRSEANVWNFPPFLFHCILWGRVSWGLEYYKNCGSRVRINWRTVTIFFFCCVFRKLGRWDQSRRLWDSLEVYLPTKWLSCYKDFPTNLIWAENGETFLTNSHFWKLQRHIRDVCMHCHAFLKGKMRQNTQFCSSEWIVFWMLSWNKTLWKEIGHFF